MSAPIETSLRGLWQGWVTPPLRASEAPDELARRLHRADEAFDDLVGRYGGPGRYYHNLLHVHEVIRAILSVPGPKPREVVLAGFLHDVVYDSRASDNEERSAEYARELLKGLGVEPGVREETARLILLTKTHETSDTDAPGRILLDADLAILGAEPEVYDAYARAIRQEYAWVPEAEYRAGRRRVLERFLTRPHIYYSAAFRAREDRARSNITHEIASLG